MRLSAQRITAALVAFISLLLVVVLSATSCRSSQKNKSSSQVLKDSAAVIKSNAGQVSKADSAGRSSVQQGTKTETDSKTGNQVNVKFNQDTGTGKTPIKVDFNSDGSITVDPGGRHVNEIEFKQKKKEQRKDSTGTTTKQGAKESKLDSSWLNKSDSAGNRQVVIDETQTVKRSAPWQLYAAGVFLLLAVLFVAYKIVKR